MRCCRCIAQCVTRGREPAKQQHPVSSSVQSANVHVLNDTRPRASTMSNTAHHVAMRASPARQPVTPDNHARGGFQRPRTRVTSEHGIVMLPRLPKPF